MEYRAFGKNGLKVSLLGFGGSEIGFQGVPAETVSGLLNQALDAGLNVLDTAECYKDSEEKIGETVSHRRGEYYLFTKCGHASGFDEPDWDPAMLAKTIDRSLQRLKTDYADLVQLHSCGEDLLRQGDVIEVLMRAKEAGKTRLIGYSGDNEAALYAVQCGAFDTLQTSCSIADQDAIERTLPLAAEKGMGVIIKRPVANAAWLNGDPPPNAYHRPYWERLRELDYAFLKGPDSLATALRFTASVPGVCTMIVGTMRPGRWAENAAHLAQGPLEAGEYAAIRARWREVAREDWLGNT